MATIGSFLAGCGSAALIDLPPQSPPLSRPPAGTLLEDPPVAPPQPPSTLDGGRVRVAIDRRAHALDAVDARTGRRIGRIRAGIGPSNVVTDGANLAYVADTLGDAVLVVRLRPRLEITRRVHVPGAPYGLAIDRGRGRLFATAVASNELVMLSAGARPRPLKRFPAVRQPDRVAVEPRSGRVIVTGRGAQLLAVP